MSWKSENSIKRIFNTFKRVRNQIFSQDIDALRHLEEVINDSNKRNAVDNILFAKLLCHVLNTNLHHYGNMKNSLSVVQDALKKPLDHSIEILSINLNNQEFNNYLKSIGVNLDFEETKEQAFKNEEVLKSNQKEIIEKIKNNWSKSKVEKSFVNTINEFLRDTDNYV